MPLVPDDRFWQPSLGTWMSTGEPAREAVRRMPAGDDVAIDIETPNTTDSFTIKCVTASWRGRDGDESVCLDPLRDDRDHWAVSEIARRAGSLGLHKSDFDTPGLVAAGLLTYDQIRAKILDTLIYARSAWPDTLVKKSLSVLGPQLLGIPFLKGGLDLSRRAAGFRSESEWYARADIDMPAYRFGAMSDTLVTLRLLGPLREAAIARQLDHPFSRHGCTTRAEAAALVDIPQQANRIMLCRACRGLAVDLEYLDTFRDTVEVEVRQQSAVLEALGLRPGNGADLVTYLDRQGELPAGWPRTEKTGRLSAARDHLKELHHPLADAHRAIADAEKTISYLESVVARSSFTGRLHPQYAILGASATGRMSMAEPPIQQFSEPARPIILEDAPGAGVTSTDWSSIEPALLAWAANDIEFIEPFERGADIYEPIQRAAGIARTPAKVVSLAVRYGMSMDNTAKALGVDIDRAKAIRRAMFDAMPGCARLMGKISQIADDHGMVITLAGRILTIPRVKGKVAGYKAINYFCQGSNADLIYTSIIALDRAGLGDAIMIPMHDEIVSITDAGPDVERVMQTPPDYFTRWTSRTPTIRTDRQDLGSCWKKC